MNKTEAVMVPITKVFMVITRCGIGKIVQGMRKARMSTYLITHYDYFFRLFQRRIC